MFNKAPTIALVAPSSIPQTSSLEASIALVESWGYNVVSGRNVAARHRYNAGNAAQRVDDLTWAMTDPQIDVVWLARGGYGLAHCLPRLPFDRFLDKVVIGYSDATALLGALRQSGNKSRLVHGPMLETLATDVDDETRATIRNLIAGDPAISLQGTSVDRAPLEPISGRVVGGNITVLASLAGTPWSPRSNDSILLLEDIGEAAYRIDRCITQLILCGAFEGVRAVGLGEFVRCSIPAEADYTPESLVSDLLEPLGLPVVRGLQFGHGSRNLAWPYGGLARLSQATIEFR